MSCVLLSSQSVGNGLLWLEGRGRALNLVQRHVPGCLESDLKSIANATKLRMDC